MKNILRAALLVAGASFAATAMPAAAQVNGIATSDPAMVILKSKARDAAYKQINTTYTSQIAQIKTMQTELNGIRQQLDTNGDKQVDQTEYNAKPSVVAQMNAKEQQIATATGPIVKAQAYSLEQIINAYEAARNQVITRKKIALMLSPDALQYAPDSVDVTDDIVAALDQQLPSVNTTVPANWQPRRETAQTHEAIQQMMMMIAAQQASAQPAAAPAPATSGR